MPYYTVQHNAVPSCAPCIPLPDQPVNKKYYALPAQTQKPRETNYTTQTVH